jgi:hypothetical protein
MMSPSGSALMRAPTRHRSHVSLIARVLRY